MKIVDPNIMPCPVCRQNMMAVAASHFGNMAHVTYLCDCGNSYGKCLYINEDGEYTE